jgi:hypothetical protein
MESADDMFCALRADEYWSRLTAKYQENDVHLKHLAEVTVYDE